MRGCINVERVGIAGENKALLNRWKLMIPGKHHWDRKGATVTLFLSQHQYEYGGIA